MATFRQMQRWLHRSEKATRPVHTTMRDGQELHKLVSFLSGQYSPKKEYVTSTYFSHGLATNGCDCEDCMSHYDGLLGGEQLKKLLDAMARKFGPDKDVGQFFQELEQQQRQEQQEQSDDDSDESSEDDDADSAVEAAIAQAAANRAAAKEAAKPTTAPPTPGQAAQKEADAQADARAERAQEAENLRKQIAAMQQQMQARGNESFDAQDQNARDARTISRLRQRLKIARKVQSVNLKSSPSLHARRGVSRGLGRLRKVDAKTRAKMADLINRILGKGLAGGQLTPIPVTDPRRLVKRMLSRRPLSNSYKEDSNSGRPAILFLPDISPSCAAQAQVACDIANAAGYAGVSGADVLVMPHFNGDIDSSCEEYMPWMNGRPLTLFRKEQEALFSDATQGRRFNVRAVVIIADHDGEWLYKQLVELPKIQQVIWLHNYSARQPEIARNQFLWPNANTPKMTAVVGCTDAPTIMRGLELAT